MTIGGLEIEVKELEGGIYAMEDETCHKLGEKSIQERQKNGKKFYNF